MHFYYLRHIHVCTQSYYTILDTCIHAHVHTPTIADTYVLPLSKRCAYKHSMIRINTVPLSQTQEYCPLSQTHEYCPTIPDTGILSYYPRHRNTVLLSQTQEYCPAIPDTGILSRYPRHRNTVPLSQTQEYCPAIPDTGILSRYPRHRNTVPQSQTQEYCIMYSPVPDLCLPASLPLLHCRHVQHTDRGRRTETSDCSCRY